MKRYFYFAKIKKKEIKMKNRSNRRSNDRLSTVISKLETMICIPD